MSGGGGEILGKKHMKGWTVEINMLPETFMVINNANTIAEQ